ncbi:MAG: hypothetical protein OEW19_17580, partial [Acidobacteriota bacterium]|nr:hypothetical protein [Acidobacteriota bacterium]
MRSVLGHRYRCKHAFDLGELRTQDGVVVAQGGVVTAELVVVTPQRLRARFEGLDRAQADPAQVEMADRCLVCVQAERGVKILTTVAARGQGDGSPEPVAARERGRACRARRRHLGRQAQVP